jgi:hypothetical protein
MKRALRIAGWVYLAGAMLTAVTIVALSTGHDLGRNSGLKLLVMDRNNIQIALLVCSLWPIIWAVILFIWMFDIRWE